ncbi:LPD7 domain-containing protein [Acidithiobacillus caldus]|uniref:LPD7 domain-containing protein n=1 Tax=Acidithiobacillus caldus TaxID=33059 RepID=UPI000305BB35|nr:LPD7 domain-containing protein [Acidithiobacillus caldus]
MNNKFVLSKRGNIDFGYLSEDAAKAIRRQAGPIRLLEEDLKHIIERHGEQIRRAGYPDIPSFLQDVCDNYNAIYVGNIHGSLLLTVRKPGSLSRVAVVMLQPADPENNDRKDFYAVRTAMITREKYYSRNAPLLHRDAPITISLDEMPFGARPGAVEEMVAEAGFSVKTTGDPWIRSSERTEVEVGMGTESIYPDSTLIEEQHGDEARDQQVNDGKVDTDRDSPGQKQDEQEVASLESSDRDESAAGGGQKKLGKSGNNKEQDSSAKDLLENWPSLSPQQPSAPPGNRGGEQKNYERHDPVPLLSLKNRPLVLDYGDHIAVTRRAMFGIGRRAQSKRENAVSTALLAARDRFGEPIHFSGDPAFVRETANMAVKLGIAMEPGNDLAKHAYEQALQRAAAERGNVLEPSKSSPSPQKQVGAELA